MERLSKKFKSGNAEEYRQRADLTFGSRVESKILLCYPPN
jgi:hypothetical protein